MNNNQVEKINENQEKENFKYCVNCKNYINDVEKKGYCKKIKINQNHLGDIIQYQNIGIARSLFGDCGRSAKFFEKN